MTFLNRGNHHCQMYTVCKLYRALYKNIMHEIASLTSYLDEHLMSIQ